MSSEARLDRNDAGLVPATPGWFVVNVADAAWLCNDAFGAACVFEGPEAGFPEVGFRLRVLDPDQPNALYHRESAEEHFLVLVGRCRLLIDGEERELRPWDFVHCPAGTEHVFVGVGDEPCAIVMVGARREAKTITYPVADIARRLGAGVATETDSPGVAYEPFPEWQLERPDMTGLPWA